MMSKRGRAIANLLGLILALIGGLLASASLKIRPSHFRLVETRDELGMALCKDDKKVAGGFGGPLTVTNEACPGIDDSHPTPEVTADHPLLAKISFWIVIAAFAFRIPAAIGAIEHRTKQTDSTVTPSPS